MEDAVIELARHDGRLHGTQTVQGPASKAGVPSDEEDAVQDQTSEVGVAFYRKDFALDFAPDGRPVGTRSDFVRGPDGKVACRRNHGRLHRHLTQ